MCIVVCFTSRLALRIFVFVSNAALSPLKIGGSFWSCSHTEGREAAASMFAHGFALHFHLRIVHGAISRSNSWSFILRPRAGKPLSPSPKVVVGFMARGNPKS